MSSEISGIHHVTAIASNPQENLDFYVGLLGLRLVKQTVNFDDPGTYHFYFGDERGRPGTILTFFPIARAHQGEPGTGQVAVTGLSIPAMAFAYWRERLTQADVRVEESGRHFGAEVLTVYDPDGLRLELVASDRPGPGEPWPGAVTPPEFAIHGVSYVRLLEAAPEATLALLTDVMGFRNGASEKDIQRCVTGAGGPGTIVEIERAGAEAPGRVAAGSVHHVAFRVPDVEALEAWRARLLELEYNVTEVKDRQYFHSIYFREPGGVLFELATDVPGFLIDEGEGFLGTRLKLPPWLEPQRVELSERLPAITVPE